MISSSVTSLFLTLEHWDLLELRLCISRIGYPAGMFKIYESTFSPHRISIKLQDLIKEAIPA